LSSKNYKEAIQILSERFGNPQVLIFAHIESLLKFNRIKNKEDVKGLKKLYNDIENCIRSLKTLKLDVTGYGCVLIPILLSQDHKARECRSKYSCNNVKGNIIYHFVYLERIKSLIKGQRALLNVVATLRKTKREKSYKRKP